MLEGNKDYVFELYEAYSKWEWEDSADWEVFEEFETRQSWDYDDSVSNEVFDPEFNPQTNIMTEASEDLITEDGIELIY